MRHTPSATALQEVPRAAQGAFVSSIARDTMLDLTMGLGSLLYGHGRTEVLHAVNAQMSRGWVPGGCDEIVEQWISRIVDLIPCAERVRPTASATEANLLALRLARSITRRSWVMRFDGHYHGCFDEALAHDARTVSAEGLHPMAASRLLVLDEADRDRIDDYLETGQVAAVLVEPGGGGGGILPYNPAWLAHLRATTTRTGTMLIFDESMTAFRYGPGGVQAETGVQPDLCTLSKVLTGGMPGAALVGSAEDLERVADHSGASGAAVNPGGVPHTSTFAGHPLGAAAGNASLELASDGVPQKQAEANAARICAELNRAAQEVDSDWRVFRTRSILHFLLESRSGNVADAPSRASAATIQVNGPQHRNLSRAWIENGVIAHPVHSWISSAHGDDALDFLACAAPNAFIKARDLDGELTT